jgi:intracellular multiplication protein IcmL
VQTQNNNTDDAIVLVQVRNGFYRQKYHMLLGVFVLGVAVAIILAGVLFYLIRYPTRPLYFVADDVGRLMYEVPLTQPSMSLQDVSAWVIEAVEASYTYNYINFRSQLQDAEKYFSRWGWQEYMKGLTASNNLIALQQRRMLFIAKVTQPPKLIAEGILGGVYSYKFEMPVLISYLSPPYSNVIGTSRFDNALVVDVIVQRQKILSSYKGLAVVQMLASTPPAQPPQNVVMPSG